jgi:AcrR family transcriptional regulator
MSAQRLRNGRLTERGQQRRDELVRHAVRLIDERGVDATRVTDIAEAAGVPSSLFYWYFRDLHDLLRVALVENRGYIRREMARAVEGINDPLERLYVAVWWCVFVGATDEIHRVMTTADVERAITEPYAAEVRRSFDIFIDDAVRLLAEGQARGVIRRNASTLHLAYALRGSVHYNVMQFHRGTIAGTPDVLADEIAGYAIRGVCTDLEHAASVERASRARRAAAVTVAG